MLHNTYTPSGQKISQQLEVDGKISTRRDYAGSFVYVNNQLAWVNIPHGRMVNKTHGGKEMEEYVLEYHLRDHLGNTRATYQGGNLTSQSDYYPFGLTFYDGASQGTSTLTQNRYLYNGKELQDDFGLDWGACPAQCGNYGARFYDAQIGRFHSIDPLAEQFAFQSPFVYAANNPIRFIDYMGMSAEEPDEEEQRRQQEEQAAQEATTPAGSMPTLIDLGKELVEGFADPVVFTTSSLLSSVGNTVLGLNKKIKRVGFIQALDEGSIDVLSNEERFSPIGFSFENEKLFKKEEPNFSGTVPIEDGKRMMKGTVTMISAGVQTVGLVASGIKKMIGAGVKTVIDSIPEDNEQQ